MTMSRRISRKVMVGRIAIGGGAPVVVQSMTNTDTADAAATIRQVHELARAGYRHLTSLEMEVEENYGQSATWREALALD